MYSFRLDRRKWKEDFEGYWGKVKKMEGYPVFIVSVKMILVVILMTKLCQTVVYEIIFPDGGGMCQTHTKLCTRVVMGLARKNVH